MTELTLYDDELDDQCYKVRLLLGMLGCRFVKIAVDVHPGGDQKSAKYLKLNPLGTLPIIADGDFVLHGAEAILAYLACRYDTVRAWLPADPEAFSLVMQWLAFAGRDLQPASIARSHAILDVKADGAAAYQLARHGLRFMDDHLTKREFDRAHWFVGERPTIADLALFPAIALSRDFGIDHDEYPALRRWMSRVRGIPGFTTMPGIPAYH